jgi:hypothetical protein
VRLNRAQLDVFESKEMREITMRMLQSGNDKAALDKAQAEQQKLAAQGRKRALDAARADPQSNAEVITLFEALNDSEEGRSPQKINELQRRLGVPMGQLELGPDQTPAPGVDRLTAGGNVSRSGKVLNFQWLTFTRVSEGAPAFVAWLDAQGCREFTYDIHANLDVPDDQNDASDADAPN